MEWFEKLIENPVLLSISTGIITFIITWPINNWLTKRTSKKEYYNRVNNCNENIIQTCEDYVIMAHETNEDVFENIIKGMCVEYKITLEEAYSVQSVKAILISNFVNMRLISDNDKKEIIGELCEKNMRNKKDNVVEQIVSISTRDNRNITFITTGVTMLISIISMIMAIEFSIGSGTTGLENVRYDYYQFSDIPAIVIALMITIVVFEVAIVMFIHFRIKYRRKARRKKKNETDIRRP